MLIPEDTRQALDEIRNAQGAVIPRSMPPSFYTHPDILSLEVSKVFSSSWLCVGRASDLPDPGDYQCIELFNEPLVVVRQKNHELRALSNVCRHRGSIILSGSGSTQRLTCPYHRWTYELDGSLKGAPLMDKLAHFDKTQCQLPEFPCTIWMGWIFINLDPNASALVDQLTGLNALVSNYHAQEMHSVEAAEESWPVNWKCLAENFMEGYHLTPVHRKTLHPMTPTRLCEKVSAGPGYTAYKSHYDENFKGRTEYHPAMTEEEKTQSMMVWIYPSFVAAISPNSAVYMSITPEGPEQLKTCWGVIARPSLFKDGEAQERFEFARAFNTEDRTRLLDVQKGLKSRFAQRGFLAPKDYEGCVWDFYQFMADRLS
ncbi:MAG: aromatic ring-hydroxylating dioxygenase subunit alpha [Granulosicoccus sp.]|nr:aromatic ring-hydroxylating dioxygenase subunit alpha [Granulosicoccus sp.]